MFVSILNVIHLSIHSDIHVKHDVMFGSISAISTTKLMQLNIYFQIQSPRMSNISRGADEENVLGPVGDV